MSLPLAALMLPPRCLELEAVGLESVLGHFEADGLLRVDHLADLHVADQREEHRHLVFCGAGARADDVEHVVDCDVGCLVERVGRGDGDEVRLVLQNRVCDLELGQGGQRDGRVACGLSAGYADLAVAHHGVHVAAAKQRAVACDGEVERSAGGDGGVVHVAAVGAGSAAVDGLAGGGDADDADHRAQGQVELVHPADGFVAHGAQSDGPLVEAVTANALVLAGGAGSLRVELDVVDRDLERTARDGAFDVDGAGGGVDHVPVDAVEAVFLRLDLVAKAVLGADAHRLAALNLQHRLEVLGKRVQDLLVVQLDHLA